MTKMETANSKVKLSVHHPKNPLSLILVALLCFSLSYAIPSLSFGKSKITIERNWIIESQGSPFTFTGNLVVNNSNQKVSSLALPEGMTYEVNQDGLIILHYAGGPGTTSLNARADVIVDYDTKINQDVPFQQPSGVLEFTKQTKASSDMVLQAQLLSNSTSSLSTIAHLANWVHNYITYDLKYWGLAKPAQSVFKERRGVCVEYTHLFISLARSLGYKTRYVTGYVYTTGWQAHAWSEVYLESYGWLPVDPTFGQVGVLDNSHIAIAYGSEQSSIFDQIISKDDNANIDVKDKIAKVASLNDEKGISISIKPDNSTYSIRVEVTNSRSDFFYGTYIYLITPGYGDTENRVILLPPNSVTSFDYQIKSSSFQKGLLYKVPITVYLDDSIAEGEFVLANPDLTSTAGNEGFPGLDEISKDLSIKNSQAPQYPCLPAALFSVLTIMAFASSKR